MGITLTGLDSLNEKWDKLSNGLDDNVFSIIQKLAQEITDEAKDLAPVDTGNLRANIFWATENKGDIIEAEVISNADYGGYVEFGTGQVGASAGLNYSGINLSYRMTPWCYQDEEGNWHYTKGMKPQPYLYPAMKRNEDRVKRELGSAITLELR